MTYPFCHKPTQTHKHIPKLTDPKYNLTLFSIFQNNAGIIFGAVCFPIQVINIIFSGSSSFSEIILKSHLK